MSDPNTIPSNQELQSLSEDILGIADVVDSLPTAAKIDAAPKIERLQVMEQALFRDLAEARSSERGADSGTVENLFNELRRETTNLKQEMSVINQGNPTTISAVGDVAMDAIEAAANKVAKGVEAVRDKISSDPK